MSTRLFVKNIPKHATEEKLKTFFSQKGQVTDVKILKKKYSILISISYTSGVSRQIGFVGYKTEEEAKAAVAFFNNTYFNTSKLSVSFAEAVFSFSSFFTSRRARSLLVLGVAIRREVLLTVDSIQKKSKRVLRTSLLARLQKRRWTRRRAERWRKQRRRKVGLFESGNQ